jgi:hypothetical protein
LTEVVKEVAKDGMKEGMKPLETNAWEKFDTTVEGTELSDPWGDFRELPEEGSEESDWGEFREYKYEGDPKDTDPRDLPGMKNDLASNLTTRNEGLKDQKHPETGVPFKEKTVTDAEGNEVTGVFPEFDSEFDAQLPEELEQASDKEQFDECNKQLKEAVENDPELAKKFTPEQLEQIKNGDTPDGYTWHHNEEKGKMQLVDSETHAKTGHTGGKVIWGGGSENR